MKSIQSTQIREFSLPVFLPYFIHLSTLEGAFHSFLIFKCVDMMPTVSLLSIAPSWMRDPCVSWCAMDISQYLLSLRWSLATHSL